MAFGIPGVKRSNIASSSNSSRGLFLEWREIVSRCGFGSYNERIIPRLTVSLKLLSRKCGAISDPFAATLTDTGTK